MSRQLKVYLVEDSTILRERVTESIAERPGIEVIGYADTEDEALNGIRSCEPDAVVLDIHLREGNGLNVLQRLDTLGLAYRPLLIVLTNNDQPEYHLRALALGSNYFFDKRSEFNRVGEVLATLAGY